LQTVNAEQQSKMDELARVNNDMRNLLNSTEIVTVFLDNELRVRRFTPGADKIFKLLPGDVGRPLSDITSNLHYPEMTEEAQEVLRKLAFSEKQITTSDGRWFSVRIMPYRTTDNRIDGVVMTFSEVTRAKLLETELRATDGMFQALLQTLPAIIIGLSGNGQILEFNRAAEQLLKRTRNEVMGGNFLELFIPQADRAKVAADLQKMLTAAPGQTWTTSVVTADQTPLALHWSARPILAADGKGASIIAIGQNMNADA
jgi:two-component system CheB/CheR fusion protein